MGDIEAQRGAEQMKEAADFYRQAIDLSGQLGMRPLSAHCHFSLGTLHRKFGRADEAEAELNVAVDLYHATDMTVWLPKAQAALANVGAGNVL